MSDWLLDSNILLRVVRRADPDHRIVRAAVTKLWQRGATRYYLPQNLVEFWNVCTRPATSRGGFGLSLAEADQAARLIERLFMLLPDSPAIHTEWRRLVTAYGVHGVQVHDARIAAAMRIHGITQILTLNTADFARYPGVSAIHPANI